eukprot:992370-Rhodomonas_salina.1
MSYGCLFPRPQSHSLRRVDTDHTRTLALPLPTSHPSSRLDSNDVVARVEQFLPPLSNPSDGLPAFNLVPSAAIKFSPPLPLTAPSCDRACGLGRTTVTARSKAKLPVRGISCADRAAFCL